jgi:hypothetical protein
MARADGRGARARAGNAAFAAVSVVCLLGFGALTVDIGHARKARAELQNAVDAAAHAAILEVNGTEEGLVFARAAALDVASYNLSDGVPVELAAEDVVFGTYDGASFTPSADATLINAVTVAHQKLDIDAIFGPVAFGVTTLGAGASALAVLPDPTPASAVRCYLPLAVPKCAVTGAGVFDFQAGSNLNDTAGWAALPDEDGSAPNAAFIKGQLSGEICAHAEIGGTVTTMNGSASVATSTATTRINYGDDGAGPWTARDVVYHAPDAWPLEEWPVQPAATEQISASRVDAGVFGQYGIAGPIMLVTMDEDEDGEDDFCDDDDGDGLPDDPPNWTGRMTLDGFAYGMIYDGRNGGASGATLRLRINTEYSFDDFATDGGGSADYGLMYQEPARVMPIP